MSHRFLLIDSPRGLHGDALKAWVSAFRDQKPELRSYGALYYPWVLRRDALEPPCGAVLGVFSREASSRGAFGVVWPPANVPVYRLSGMEIDLDWSEARALAAESINPLIMEQGLGTTVSGARTLSKKPQWEFINARRTISMITEQLRRDNQWVVFEQNDPRIWKSLERDVRVRLDQFWSGGLLTGKRAGSDYQVICNEESNSKRDRESGVMNVWVDLRPVGTTEHVRIELRLTDSVS
jgi:phage tail sheath protein FI